MGFFDTVVQSYPMGGARNEENVTHLVFTATVTKFL